MDRTTVMRLRVTPWLVGATLTCALFWGGVSVAGVKLADLYVHRGPEGFRHALSSRVDHKLGRFKAIVIGAGDIV